MPIDVAQNNVLYPAVWYTHFSGILSVKGPNSNRSRYAHLWRADCVRGSSISCHTVAVPIMLKNAMQVLNVPRYNKPRSGSQHWHMPPYFPAPNLLCLLQYIPLEVNLVYQIIKINFTCRRAEPSNDFSTTAPFHNELPSKSSPVAPCSVLLPDFFIIQPTRRTNFTNLFWHETLHVSGSSSVHHQWFIYRTLSNGICHTGCRQLSSCSILVFFESCLQTCITYTIADYTVNKLLMMDKETARNLKSFMPK
jgi:hypothetical protein